MANGTDSYGGGIAGAMARAQAQIDAANAEMSTPDNTNSLNRKRRRRKEKRDNQDVSAMPSASRIKKRIKKSVTKLTNKIPNTQGKLVSSFNTFGKPEDYIELNVYDNSNTLIAHLRDFKDYTFTKEGTTPEGLTNEVIVDAYCGIGYYSLQFLVRSNAKHLHACEINSESITALKMGLKRNGVEDKCTIHEGDNRVSMNSLKGVADRVILGLIPSSLNTWGHAVKCLKPTGGVIHVHMNVHEDEILDWQEKTVQWFTTVSGMNVEAIHLEDVKSYCPHIQHVVLDLKFS